MIITVTPNPSIDRTLHVASFTRGEVHRALRESAEPSGKGVNVSLALHGAGVETRAVLPVGGASGAQLAAMLDAVGLEHDDVPVTGAIRMNISLVEADGTTSKINEVGPSLAVAEVDALLAAALGRTREGHWTAWCGSLPAGFGPHLLADAVAQARRAGGLVAVDTSGTALTSLVGEGPDRLPHLVKPNADELAEITGRPLASIGDVVDAAGSLLARGIRTVLVSLGPDGAVLVEDGVRLHGVAPVERVVNTVGAGDAFLAGYLAVHDRSARERLTSALRYAAAAVQHEGTLFSGADETVPVFIDDCDRSRPLSEPTRESTP